MTDRSANEPEKELLPGRLRIYLGAAPGVGKTYQMLKDAHLLKQQGVDVVVGLVEPRGREETAALVGGLEVIPRRAAVYRSIALEEMDLDAILKRRPHTSVVDDLAHTNVPGAKNRRRYEDVLELLEAGVNVLTALNIQHVETLNDSVSRSAKAAIRETVPDSILKRADEIVNVDLTAEQLRARLRQGKIYSAEKIEQSLANFFRKGNLNMLRELALRTTAEEVGSRAAEYRRSQGLEQPPLPEKVMVCISPRAGTDRLLRAGARIAGRVATDWCAVRVAPPGDAATGENEELDQRMQEYQRLATELGARVVILRDKHIASALIEYAKRENVSHVVFGQSARSRMDILLRGSVINRFLAECRDVTVQVVPMSKKK